MKKEKFPKRAIINHSARFHGHISHIFDEIENRDVWILSGGKRCGGCHPCYPVALPDDVEKKYQSELETFIGLKRNGFFLLDEADSWDR